MQNTMKKLLLTAAGCAVLMATSCTKNAEGNTSVIKDDNGAITIPVDTTVSKTNGDGDSTTADQYTDRYVAEDGSSALVTFKNGTDKTISIQSNNKTISAPQKESNAERSVYGNYDIEIVAKNDSVTITQGNNVIRLRKAKGE